MTSLLRTFTHDASGATAVEYALMLACIAVVIIAAVMAIGTNTNKMYENEILLKGLK